jgi:hypothetical protein
MINKVFKIRCKVQEIFIFVEFDFSIREEIKLPFLKTKFTEDEQIHLNKKILLKKEI